jgi:hypothetical protein
VQTLQNLLDVIINRGRLVHQILRLTTLAKMIDEGSLTNSFLKEWNVTDAREFLSELLYESSNDLYETSFDFFEALNEFPAETRTNVNLNFLFFICFLVGSGFGGSCGVFNFGN